MHDPDTYVNVSDRQDSNTFLSLWFKTKVTAKSASNITGSFHSSAPSCCFAVRGIMVMCTELNLTLCMLGNFFKYLFLSKLKKQQHCFHPFFLLIFNLNVKQFGSQMKPHILWGFIWIQIVCIHVGHQRSSKFTASGLRVNIRKNKFILMQTSLIQASRRVTRRLV